MSTSKLIVKGKRLIDSYDNESFGEGETFCCNGWDITIRGKKIICHTEGPPICHKEFPLKDGLLVLVSGNHLGAILTVMRISGPTISRLSWISSD